MRRNIRFFYLSYICAEGCVKKVLRWMSQQEWNYWKDSRLFWKFPPRTSLCMLAALWGSKQIAEWNSNAAPSSRPLINWRIKSHLQLRINTRINNDNDFCFLSFQVHVEAHGVNNEMFECNFVLSQPPQSPAVSDRNTGLLPWWLSPANQEPGVYVCLLLGLTLL